LQKTDNYTPPSHLYLTSAGSGVEHGCNPRTQAESSRRQFRKTPFRSAEHLICGIQWVDERGCWLSKSLNKGGQRGLF
jgi:hypothetical protein